MLQVLFKADNLRLLTTWVGEAHPFEVYGVSKIQRVRANIVPLAVGTQGIVTSLSFSRCILTCSKTTGCLETFKNLHGTYPLPCGHIYLTKALREFATLC